MLHSERTQGFAADPDYWKGEVFAYVGLPQNLKDLNVATSTSPPWETLWHFHYGLPEMHLG